MLILSAPVWDQDFLFPPSLIPATAVGARAVAKKIDQWSPPLNIRHPCPISMVVTQINNRKLQNLWKLSIFIGA